MKEIIFVTQPFLPDLDEFLPYLRQIWESKHLTNRGPYHEQLERELEKYLNVPNISLFTNGTLALITAIQALDLKGEVITTPYSFVATSHSLIWNSLTPVFVDIERHTGNMDSSKIESAITPDTAAILPVHVYGHPCNNDEIQRIANKHNLKVIYDAAHAFNVKREGQSILNWGDLSILSFHATKSFSTFEGGAIISHTKEMKNKIDNLKNFGILNELTIMGTGINSKMNEFQAALGLLQLKHFGEVVRKRKNIFERYMSALSSVQGLEFFTLDKEVEYNYTYFPIMINPDLFGKARDEVYEHLKQNNIFSRRYFYPLISSLEVYNVYPSSHEFNLVNANYISNRILCLPIYPDLTAESVDRISDLLIAFSK